MATKVIYRTIGRRLDAALTMSMITHRDIGAKLGYAAPTVSGWVQGRRKPSLTVLKKVSEATGVSMEFLLRGNVSPCVEDKNAAALIDKWHEEDEYERFLKTEEGMLEMQQSADTDARSRVMEASLHLGRSESTVASYAPPGTASHYHPTIILFTDAEMRKLTAAAKSIVTADHDEESAIIDLVRAAVGIALQNKSALQSAARALR